MDYDSTVYNSFIIIQNIIKKCELFVAREFKKFEISSEKFRGKKQILG